MDYPREFYSGLRAMEKYTEECLAARQTSFTEACSFLKGFLRQRLHQEATHFLFYSKMLLRQLKEEALDYQQQFLGAIAELMDRAENILRERLSVGPGHKRFAAMALHQFAIEANNGRRNIKFQRRFISLVNQAIAYCSFFQN